MSAYDKLKDLSGNALALVKDNLNNSVTALSDIRARLDSWSNALSGLATSRDKTTSTVPFLDALMSPMTLEALYHGDDIAARIVSALPDECFREGFMVVSKSAAKEVNEYLKTNPKPRKDVARGIAAKSMSDTLQERANELQMDLNEHGATEKLREAMTWGRLYGLGAILLGINDGRETWEPVDTENVVSIDYMTVLDKRDLVPWRWYSDPLQAKFADVSIYLMQPVGVYIGMGPETPTAGNQVMLVHESRLIRFGGELTSKRLRLSNQGCDYSILQKCFRALQMTNDNWQSAAVLLADASQGVLKISGLIDMIAQQPDIMQSRFAFMDMARSTTRSIVLDKDGEEFERKPTPFTGIPDMLEQTWKRLASAARMPLTILMGVSPGGLNATGESDLRWWYDTVKSTQEQAVKPQLERLLRMKAAAQGWEDPEDWSVVFHPLWQLTAQEQATMHLAQAQADAIYLTNGVVTPEEMALSRFGGGKYDLNTKIDVESRKRSMQMTLEQMEVEAGVSLEAAKDPVPTPGVLHAQNQALLTTPDPGPPGTNED